MDVAGRQLYWDLTAMGRGYPDGIGRCIIALAERTYALPSTYLLPSYLDGGALHRELQQRPGRTLVCGRHPRRFRPWCARWEQILDQPGVMFAPGNVHRATRWPTIVLVHDTIPYDEPGYARFRHLSPAGYGRMLRHAAAVLAVSDHTARRIAALFPTAPPARRLVQGLFPPVPPRAPAAPPAQPFYLFVGGAEPRKRLEDAARLCSALGDGAFVVVGRDFAPRRVADLAAGVPGFVHLPACSDEELAWLYASCRALLYPTTHEGFGLPALECLRSGRPVVARRMTSLPEILDEQALWCDFASEAAAAAELRRRIDAWSPGPALAAHLARFDWDAAREAFAAVVAEVAAR